MIIKRNSKGYRIGQSHHRAKLSDADVALIFELRKQGLYQREIAEKMECGQTTVKKILSGKIRNQAIAHVENTETP